MTEIECEYQIEVIEELKEDLRRFGARRNSTTILFYSTSNINYYKAFDFLNIIRAEPPIQNLDVIIDSGGGDIVMAVKIASICKIYSKKFTVIVPFFAKSAATLIALSADDLILGKAGELGPIDPQVKHPVLEMFFSASSMKNALEFISESEDHIIKKTMADKLDPLLIGAYIRTIDESKQYLSEIPAIKNSENKEEIIKVFTEKYIDHGYPITHEICKKLALNFTLKLNDDDLESILYDIHDQTVKFMKIEDIETFILSPTNGHVSIYSSSENDDN